MYTDTIFLEYEHHAERLIKNENEYSDKDIKLDVTEIKIHSMNILRALFKHSQLGNIVKDYVANGLMVALKYYDSKIWTVSSVISIKLKYISLFIYIIILIIK